MYRISVEMEILCADGNDPDVDEVFQKLTDGFRKGIDGSPTVFSRRFKITECFIKSEKVLQ